MNSAAGTPRVLDVRDFAQARETELRYLLQAITQDVGDARLGAPFLPRHLRRRATSHRRFSVRRRPNLRLATLYGGAGPRDTDRAVTTGSSADAPAPQRRRFAPSHPPARSGLPTSGGTNPLAAAAAAGGGGAPLWAASAASAVSTTCVADFEQQQQQRPTNRGMRRRPARLQAAAEASCAGDLAPKPFDAAALGPQGSQQRTGAPVPVATEVQKAAVAVAAAAATAAVAPGPGGLRRLESHVWHCRRMAMERRWGHALAAHAAGRGRGSRSLLAQSRGAGGPLLHDSSYCGCVELRGHQRRLAGLLGRMSDPVRLGQLMDRPELISGAAEWSLLLHRSGAFPHDPLAPARAMWLTPAEQPDFGDYPQHHPQPKPQPPQQEATGVGEAAPAPSRPGPGPCPAMRPGSYSDPVDAEGWSPRCVLWLWVHAAAYEDVWLELHRAAAAEEEEEEEEAATIEAEEATVAAAAVAPARGRLCTVAGRRGSITIRSRCPDLRRIDVVGAAATAALARVLQPLPPSVAAVAPVASAAGADDGAGTSADDNFALGGRIWWSLTRPSGSADGGDDSGAGGATRGSLGLRYWRWPAGTVLGMVAADPRLTAPVRLGGGGGGRGLLAADALAEAAAAGLCGRGEGRDGGRPAAAPRAVPCLGEEELRRQLRQWPEAGDWTRGAAELWRNRGTDGEAAAASNRIPTTSSLVGAPPLDQSRVGALRQAARSRLLRIGLGGGAEAAAAAGYAGQVGGSNSGGGGGSISFPVLLIRRPEACGGQDAAGRGKAAAVRGGGRRPAAAPTTAATKRSEGVGAEGPGGGWSLVMPARWVMPLWSALAFTGARPTGQSEWRQLATHFRMPCFPYDHPYTPAGERYSREVLVELAAAAALRPVGRARRPADLSAAADWTRLMQPPPPGRPLPAALLGGKPDRSAKALTRRAAGGGRGNTDPMDLDPAPVVATATATASAAATTAGGQGHVWSGGRGGGGAARVTRPAARPAGAGPGAGSRGPGSRGPGCEAAAAGGAALGAAAATAADPVKTTTGIGGGNGGRWAVALSGGALRTFLTLRPAGDAAGRGGAQQGQDQDREAGQQRHAAEEGPVVRGRQPARKDRLHGWTLRRAVRLGLLPQPPAPGRQEQAEEQEDAAAQAGSREQGAAAASAAVTVTSVAPRQPPPQPPDHPGGRCLVYVAVRVEGRGVCQAGAEVIALPPSTAPRGGSATRPCAGISAVDGNIDLGPKALVATMAAAAGAGPPAAPSFAAPLSLSSSTAGKKAEEKKQGGPPQPRPGGSGAVLVGYVVSAATRGSTDYPGGLAVCDAQGLVGRAVGEPLAGGPACGWADVTWAGRAGRRGGGGLRLWVRNPGSTALRPCRAEVIMPEEVPTVGAGGSTQVAWN